MSGVMCASSTGSCISAWKEPANQGLRRHRRVTAEACDEHLELLGCHYNFRRPHGALKLGNIARIPAKQAGLVSP